MKAIRTNVFTPVFSKPNYVYAVQLIHPLLELYRFKRINEIIGSIKVDISDAKKRQYFSQLLMNILTNRTFSDAETIYLDDGLFNNPLKNEVDDFYRDINGISEKKINTDIFNIVDMIKNSVIATKKFSMTLEKKSDKIFEFSNNTFIIDKSVLDEIGISIDPIYVSQNIIDITKKKYSGPEKKYETYLMCCMIRYTALGSGANQFLVDRVYKNKLRKYGANFECFASAINHHYDNYCSMFYDIEQFFGSSGSFMALKINQGFYMANPPYDENLLQKMYIKVKKAISSTLPVCFIMSIPKWKNYDLERLIEMEYIYRQKELKFEYFENALTGKMHIIPPYISYLFYNDPLVSSSIDVNGLVKLFTEYSNYNLEFPARNRIYDDKYKTKLFQFLLRDGLKEIINEQKIKYDNLKLNNIDYLYRGKYHYIIVESEKYTYYSLSDMFNDECRSQCSFDGNKTPVEFYQENKKLLMLSLLDKGLPVNPVTLRNEIYLNAKECSIHNPLIMKFFIAKFHARNVLDFSAGWGDRLIGALTSNIDMYYGVDPNDCLHPNYAKMIELFAPLSPNPKAKYILINGPFEKTTLPKNAIFDLVYTSPPYFDYESYTDNQKQSMVSYDTETSWLNNFLFIAVDKSISQLKNHGHIVLYISQKKGRTYTEKMIEYIKNKKDMYYLGNIFKCQESTSKISNNMKPKKLHPCFIFQKNDTIPTDLYNPPLTVQELEYKKIKVIRDDLIIGGTKTRGCVDFLRKFVIAKGHVNELIYTGASNGYGQVAAAYSLYLLKLNIKFIVYYQDVDLPYIQKIRDIVSYLHPNTTFIKMNERMRLIKEHISKYVNDNPGSYEIPFGLGDDIFKDSMANALRQYVKDYLSDVKRMWLVIGSGTLFNIFFKLLPDTFFCLVQVGKRYTLSEEESKRAKIYVSSLKLYRDFKNRKIPYHTVDSYDGKIWEFANDFEENDYIWNVAGIHNKV